MKAKISLLALVFSGFIIFAACGTSGSGAVSGPTQSPAYSSGQTFGSSLLGLYSAYKSNGNKINFKDANTLMQLLQLSTSVNVIKENLNNKSFYGQFVSGAVLGSQQNVTQSNAGSIISSLTGLDFGNIAQTVTGGSLDNSTVSNVTSTLSTLFGAFGK